MKKMLCLMLFFNVFPIFCMSEKSDGDSDHVPDLEVAVPSTFIDIESFDLNGDGVIDKNEELLAQYALSLYFQQRRISKGSILPVLRRHIREATNSPIVSRRENILTLKRIASEGSPIDGSHLSLRYLQEIALNAATEALQSKEEESKKKISKTKATVITSAVGIMGMITSLVIHFTDSGK